MNKKLFILMFIIIAGGIVIADDNPFRDEFVQELPPRLEIAVQDNSVQNKPVRKKLFNHTKKPKIDTAKDIEVVKPDKKKLKAVKNENKKTEKKLKKTADKKQKKQTSAKKDEKADTSVIPAVNRNQDGSAVLTDTAYHASIQTNKIIEVDDCVKLALENHPAIKSAMSNAEVYKSKIAQAWSNYFPTFSAGISYSRNDMQMSNFAFPTQEYDMFYVPNVSGNMLLFDFGKTKSQADMAKRTYESAKYNLENTINSVIYLVKQSYYNLLFAQQQVKVYEDTVKDYQMHLEQAKAYYDIGTKAKIDVLTAEYNLGKAKLGLIQANNTLKIAYVQLSNAMGMPDYTDYDVTDNLKMKSYGIGIDEAVNTAYETSPELLASQKRTEAAKMMVRTSRRAFAPDITGFAGYTRGGKRVDTDYGYQFGAQLSYNTFNPMLLKKQVDEAKANYNKELADYENTKQNIYYEVKQAYLNLTAAQESVSVAKLSMEQAKEQYDQASGRYKVGLGDAIELKDAETTFRNSQLDYYNTVLNYHVSAANLEKLMGSPLKSTDNDLL